MNTESQINADAAAGPQAMTLDQAMAAMRDHASRGFAIMPTRLGLQLLEALEQLLRTDELNDAWIDLSTIMLDKQTSQGVSDMTVFRDTVHQLINLRAAAVLQRDLRK